MARVALQGSFGIINKILAIAYRRDETTENLTKRIEKNPIDLREYNERIFEKLKTIRGLKYRERKALNEIMSANRRAIGNLLLKSGRKKEARDCYKLALFMCPSTASLGKYFLSFLGIKANLWIMERNAGTWAGPNDER
jgi:hypothetical protein